MKTKRDAPRNTKQSDVNLTEKRNEMTVNNGGAMANQNPPNDKGAWETKGGALMLRFQEGEGMPIDGLLFDKMTTYENGRESVCVR